MVSAGLQQNTRTKFQKDSCSKSYPVLPSRVVLASMREVLATAKLLWLIPRKDIGLYVTMNIPLILISFSLLLRASVLQASRSTDRHDLCGEVWRGVWPAKS